MDQLTRLAKLRDSIALDNNFQTACQNYAHRGGSSAAIAMAALRVVGDDFAEALALDPEGLIGVIDLARQVWEGEELAAWMLLPNSRFADASPLAHCTAVGGADDVLDMLEQVELP